MWRVLCCNDRVVILSDATRARHGDIAAQDEADGDQDPKAMDDEREVEREGNPEALDDGHEIVLRDLERHTVEEALHRRVQHDEQRRDQRQGIEPRRGLGHARIR